VLLSSATVSAGGFPAASGGYIQLPSPWFQHVKNLPHTQREHVYRAMWRQQFDELRELGFDTVVVQYTVLDNTAYLDGKITIGLSVLQTDGSFVNTQALRTIMQEAERTGVNVWIGLRQRSTWNESPWSTLVTSGQPLLQENLAVAQAIQATGVLRSHRFAGWYIPQEIDNAPPANMVQAEIAGNIFLKALSSALKQIARKPVSISAYFRRLDGDLDVCDSLAFLEATIAGSGIDLLIFQDSVGVDDMGSPPEKHLGAAEIARLSARYGDVIAICVALGIATWADVELKVDDQDMASNIFRVHDQLEAAQVCHKTIVFDINHYLTTVDGIHGADALFRAYLQLIHGNLRP
jgi:hypothetical protein